MKIIQITRDKRFDSSTDELTIVMDIHNCRVNLHSISSQLELLGIEVDKSFMEEKMKRTDIQTMRIGPNQRNNQGLGPDSNAGEEEKNAQG